MDKLIHWKITSLPYELSLAGSLSQFWHLMGLSEEVWNLQGHSGPYLWDQNWWKYCCESCPLNTLMQNITPVLQTIDTFTIPLAIVKEVILYIICWYFKLMVQCTDGTDHLCWIPSPYKCYLTLSWSLTRNMTPNTPCDPFWQSMKSTMYKPYHQTYLSMTKLKCKVVKFC